MATSTARRRKPWCGTPGCNEQTRQRELGEERLPRPCTLCHPWRVGYLDEPGPNANAAQARDPEWWASAQTVIRTLAREGGQFTVSDLKQDRFGLGQPAERNSWGAAIRAASNAGIIRRVDYDRSSDASRHGGAVGVWVGSGGS